MDSSTSHATIEIPDAHEEEEGVRLHVLHSPQDRSRYRHSVLVEAGHNDDDDDEEEEEDGEDEDGEDEDDCSSSSDFGTEPDDDTDTVSNVASAAMATMSNANAVHSTPHLDGDHHPSVASSSHTTMAALERLRRHASRALLRSNPSLQQQRQQQQQQHNHHHSNHNNDNSNARTSTRSSISAGERSRRPVHSLLVIPDDHRSHPVSSSSFSSSLSSLSSTMTASSSPSSPLSLSSTSSSLTWPLFTTRHRPSSSSLALSTIIASSSSSSSSSSLPVSSSSTGSPTSTTATADNDTWMASPRETAVVTPLNIPVPSSSTVVPIPRFLARRLRPSSRRSELLSPPSITSSSTSSPPPSSSSSFALALSTSTSTTVTPPRGTSSDRSLVSPSLERFGRTKCRACVARAVRSIGRLTAMTTALTTTTTTTTSLMMMMNAKNKRHDTTTTTAPSSSSLALSQIGQELALLEEWTDDTDCCREDLVLVGGIRMLLDLMHTFGNNHADLMVQICNIITYLARNGSCLRALSSPTTVAAILHAMQHHVSHGLLQARACNALNNLAMREENRIRIARQGGIPQILQGMQQHVNNGEVQANGCNCLWNLAIWPLNRPLIAQANGVVRILCAMKVHITDPSLFGEGCGALWNLADHPPTRQQILQHNGIAIICAALERHKQHYVMHRLCCGALESLLNDNDLGRVLLYQQESPRGGMALILAAMRLRPHDEELQSAGCGIIANFAAGDLMQLAITSFVATLCELDAHVLLLNTMRRHVTSTKVQCRACSALSYFCYNPAARQALTEAGAMDLVQAALLEHAGDTVVFGTAVMALHQLTCTGAAAVTTTTTISSSTTSSSPNYTGRMLRREDRAPAA